MTADRSEDDGDSELDAVLARARPSGPADLLLTQAKITQALFGKTPAVGLGRFRVLDRLGAGGMGVVYAAYDPDLDRRVALKLVRVRDRERDSALAEAKAMAKLSHPNVVPVFDIGIDGDDVYIVMELVRGDTLDRWIAGRSRGDVLDVYRQAGAALVAAHRAGLVHRDFKPENAIVGDDGRVRVVDFGLACEVASTTRPAGTPKYMAPEQRAGAAVTAAADQYSFCVALEEALGKFGPLPRWLDAAVRRGQAKDPQLRFPSMMELVRALGRDPSRAWRIGIAGTVVAGVVAAAAFMVGRTRGEPDRAACDDTGAELAGWSPQTRIAAIAKLAGLGDYGRTIAPQVIAALDTHANRWKLAHRDACRAHRDGSQSDAMFDRRTRCLARDRDAIAAAVDILVHAEPSTTPQIPRAVAALADPAACGDPSIVASEIEPPPAGRALDVARVQTRVTQARVLLEAGRDGEARELAVLATAEARALGYAPLTAEALLVQGRAMLAATDRAPAIPLLAESTRLAMGARADALAVEAWARRAWAEGTTTDPAGALAGLDVVEAIAIRTSSARFATALLYNNIGSIELARNHRQPARLAFEHALAETRAVSGPGELELVNVRCNLARTTDDRIRADALLADAIAELTSRLGADHPDTLSVRELRATMTVERLADAVELLSPVCRGYDLHPTMTDRAAGCWTEAALLHDAQGRRVEAITAIERAARSPSAPPAAAALLAGWRGDVVDSSRRFTTAIAAIPSSGDDRWWNRLRRAELRAFEGGVLRESNKLVEARNALSTSIVDLIAIARDHPTATYERRLGRARVDLALVLAAQRAPPTEIRPVATAAADWLRHVGGSGTELALMEEAR